MSAAAEKVDAKQHVHDPDRQDQLNPGPHYAVQHRQLNLCDNVLKVMMDFLTAAQAHGGDRGGTDC